MYIHLYIHIQGMKFCKLNHDCRQVYIYIYIYIYIYSQCFFNLHDCTLKEWFIFTHII